MIPAGCTSLIQVLDVSVNRPFKQFLKIAMKDELYQSVQVKGERVLALFDQCDEEPNDNSSISDETILDGTISAIGLHRILLTRAVGIAWDKFQEDKQRESIKATFQRYLSNTKIFRKERIVFRVGLTLPIDGSQDSCLAVKGLLSDELVIGSWQREEKQVDSGSTKATVSGSEEKELAKEDDDNADVFFIELEAPTLQVGRKKKSKRNFESELGPESSQRKQSTCSACKQQGHIKSNRSCPRWVERLSDVVEV